MSDEHGQKSVCSNCAGDIENEDGIWWHVDSGEAFCEPDDPSPFRQADPTEDPAPRPLTPDAIERWLSC